MVVCLWISRLCLGSATTTYNRNSERVPNPLRKQQEQAPVNADGVRKEPAPLLFGSFGGAAQRVLGGATLPALRRRPTVARTCSCACPSACECDRKKREGERKKSEKESGRTRRKKKEMVCEVSGTSEACGSLAGSRFVPNEPLAPPRHRPPPRHRSRRLFQAEEGSGAGFRESSTSSSATMTKRTNRRAKRTTRKRTNRKR